MREPRLSAMTTDQMLDYVLALQISDPEWYVRREDRAGLADRLLAEYRAFRNTTSWSQREWEYRYHMMPALPATAYPSPTHQTLQYNTHIVRLPNSLKDGEAEELILRQLEEHACPR